MVKRMKVLTAVVALAALGAMTAPPSRAEAAADKSWCMTYCDTIHLGCQKAFGWFDKAACDEWKQGCLDGCRVNG